MKHIQPFRLLGLTAALLLASSQGAWAQTDGWYGGVNAGRTAATIDDARINNTLRANGFTSNAIQNDDRSNGFKVFGGYQLNRNFAIEGGYFDLGKFGYTATTVPQGTLTGDIKLKGLNLDVVGLLPLSDRFSAFGRVGLNYAQARDTFRGTGAVTVRNPNPSVRDTNLKLGAGLQYAVTDALSVRGEIERYRVNDGGPGLLFWRQGCQAGALRRCRRTLASCCRSGASAVHAGTVAAHGKVHPVRNRAVRV